MLVLVASGVARLARRGQAPPPVRGAEGATGVGDLTLHHSLRVAVESVELEEELAARGREDGSGTKGIERGKGIGVLRYPEESRRLREHRVVTENAGLRGTGGHCHCLVRVHHRVAVDNFSAFKIVYLKLIRTRTYRTGES